MHIDIKFIKTVKKQPKNVSIHVTGGNIRFQSNTTLPSRMQSGK